MEMHLNDPDQLRETVRRLKLGTYLLDRQLVLQKYAATDLITSLRPTQGGMVMSQPYQGETFDPQHSRVIKGGWNHEHCFMCKAKVLPGDEWWAALPPGGDIGLCLDCHDLLGRSSQEMQSAGLVELREKGYRADRERAEAVTTEAEWLSSTIPRSMLSFLEARAKAGDINRKLRLFACACVRRIWHLLDDERSRNAVEVAERYAEGMATPEELNAADHEAGYAASGVYVSGGLQHADKARMEGVEVDIFPDGTVLPEKPEYRAWEAANAAKWVTARKVGVSGTTKWYEGGAWVAASTAPMSAFEALAEAEVIRANEVAYRETARAIEEPLTATDPITGAAEILAKEAANDATVVARRLYVTPWQADLLRCIFGNPFRTVTVDPAWLTPASVALARSIDEHRSFDRLPDLADALEEAGCRDDTVLYHCRKPADHARGCWVVDTVLGKA
jgi:hypothetical protein